MLLNQIFNWSNTCRVIKQLKRCFRLVRYIFQIFGQSQHRKLENDWENKKTALMFYRQIFMSFLLMQAVVSMSQLQYFQLPTIVEWYKKNQEMQKFCPL